MEMENESQAPTNAGVAQMPPVVSMKWAFVLICIVFWCGGWMMGGIAFILTLRVYEEIFRSCFGLWFCNWMIGGIDFAVAIKGHHSAAAGDDRRAMQWRKASYGLSIAGLVIGVIGVINVLVVIVLALFWFD